eukprot:6183303-Pleurochrysis_carterae.AAC.2
MEWEEPHLVSKRDSTCRGQEERPVFDGVREIRAAQVPSIVLAVLGTFSVQTMVDRGGFFFERLGIETGCVEQDSYFQRSAGGVDVRAIAGEQRRHCTYSCAAHLPSTRRAASRRGERVLMQSGVAPKVLVCQEKVFEA